MVFLQRVFERRANQFERCLVHVETGFRSSWCTRRARQNVGQNRKCRLHPDVATHAGTEIVPALGIARATQHGQRVADREFRISEHSPIRSEEHTSELQSLMRISYAVFCLKKKNPKEQ